MYTTVNVMVAVAKTTQKLPRMNANCNDKDGGSNNKNKKQQSWTPFGLPYYLGYKQHASQARKCSIELGYDF